jgi:hypothetical protein
MWGAILTRREEQFKQKLDFQLQEQIKIAKNEQNEQILKAQNSSINSINKINIEYKYQKATKSMIHDWEKSQLFSMLWALRYIGVLA